MLCSRFGVFTAGPIPESFGGLMHLEELVLSGNALSGDEQMCFEPMSMRDRGQLSLCEFSSYLHSARGVT